jgi:hypothetical protein
MNIKALLLLVLGICMLLLATCQEETSYPQHKAEAVLIWTGDPAVDAGCGYFFRINGEEYKPDNETLIPQSLRGHASLPVIITYKPLSERIRYSCSRGADAMGEGLRLYSIHKKN